MISALGRLRQKDYKFEASLCYIASLRLVGLQNETPILKADNNKNLISCKHRPPFLKRKV
jgi:hypothetical protein